MSSNVIELRPNRELDPIEGLIRALRVALDAIEEHGEEFHGTPLYRRIRRTAVTLDQLQVDMKFELVN